MSLSKGRNEYPEAEVYKPADSSWQGQAQHGVPLYPEEEPFRPPLRRFRVAGYQDLWAALLFLAAVSVTIGFGSVNMYNFFRTHPMRYESGRSEIKPMIILPVFGACVASGLGVLLILRHCARQVIIFGNVAAICLTLLSAAMAFSSDAAALGVVLLVLAFLHALWFYFAWHRIPFSAALLKASTDLVCRYKAIVLCGFLVCGLSFLYVILWYFMVQPLFDQKNGQPDTWNCLFLVLSVLSMFWVAQVCPNVMHVTTAGVTATWYFAGESNMPSNPTAASFKRSVTTSFGSICFGSLMVAFCRFLRWVVENFSSNDDKFLRCIVSCILSRIRRMAEYFNTYAFVHVAIYGCGYLEAAKKTWDLCKRCLYAAYFNARLIIIAFQIICLTASVAIGIGTYCFTGDTTHSIIAFYISVVVHVLFVSPVESAIVTYFVCFAEVPEGLSQSAPELYNTLVALDQNATRNNAAAV